MSTKSLAVTPWLRSKIRSLPIRSDFPTPADSLKLEAEMQPAKTQIKKQTLLNELGKWEMRLVVIKRRYYFLKEYLDTLGKRRKSKNLPVRNDVIQQLIFDCYDMLINDLTSFCEGISQKHGFLQLLKKGRNHLGVPEVGDIELPDPIISDDGTFSEKERQDFVNEFKRERQSEIQEGRREALRSLFPETRDGTRSSSISERQFNAFIKNFRALYGKIKIYRNNVSGHRYEQLNAKKPIPAPTIDELTGFYDEISRLMNAIRFVLDASTFAHDSPLFNCSPKETVNDLVDLLLCGWSWHVHRRFGLSNAIQTLGGYDHLRDRFYDSSEQTE